MRILIVAALLATAAPALAQHAHFKGAPAASHALEMN